MSPDPRTATVIRVDDQEHLMLVDLASLTIRTLQWEAEGVLGRMVGRLASRFLAGTRSGKGTMDPLKVFIYDMHSTALVWWCSYLALGPAALRIALHLLGRQMGSG